jgi:GT2 family glycosyltransferase
MPDNSPRLSGHGAALPQTSALAEIPPDQIDPDFDEITYLRVYPDVAAAVQRGELSSGLEHYLLAGRAERRLELPEYQQIINPPIRSASDPRLNPARARAPGAGVDVIKMSESGAIFISGWTDDRQNPLIAMNLRVGQVPRHSWTKVPRMRRQDVEQSLHFAGAYQHGFWVFTGIDERPRARQISRDTACSLELCYTNGATAELNRVPIMVPDEDLRDEVMRDFAACDYLGNPEIEACISLDGGVGNAFIGFNRAVCQGFASQALVERFGPTQRKPKVSVIVPLYGIADYLFLQSSAFAHGRDIGAYEFIYVVNGPELIERLYREARIAQMIYGLSQALVLLPGNVGFGTAKNTAVQFARGERLLFLDPDVFPRDPHWARRHLDILTTLPEAQTRLFGTTLYYDDGSLMHGGMYFEVDATIHASATSTMRRTMVRVEHYGKGAPSWASEYVASRPVPAVSDAFLSIDRGWFEQLGGFSEDYVFGDYEDADLCLKSLQGGVPAWLHDNRMWHLEGRGAQLAPQNQGGALVNRWHFARTWTSMIVSDLLGRTPPHKLLRANAAAPTKPANAHDMQQGSAVPAGRATSRVAKPGGAKPGGAKPVGAKAGGAKAGGAKAGRPAKAGRAEQRGVKPAAAAALVRPSSHRPR